MPAEHTQVKISGRTSKVPPYDQMVTAMQIRALDLDGMRAALVRAFEEKGVPVETWTQDQLLGICHTCRFKLINATHEEKRESEQYLRQHGLM